MRSKAKPALKRGVGAEETGLILSPCGNALPLPEQSLYSGKARSSVSGMEEGLTLTKGFYYGGIWWVDPRLYLFSSTQRSAPAVIEKREAERGKLERGNRSRGDGPFVRSEAEPKGRRRLP